MSVNNSNALTLPPMLMIRQNFEVPPQLDIAAAIDSEWDRLIPTLGIPPAALRPVGSL